MNELKKYAKERGTNAYEIYLEFSGKGTPRRRHFKL